MRTGLYPGTFDPITMGHIDIIKRACSLVDRLVIGVAINRDKGPLFSLEERVSMIEAECGKLSRETGVEIVVTDEVNTGLNRTNVDLSVTLMRDPEGIPVVCNNQIERAIGVTVGLPQSPDRINCIRMIKSIENNFSA